jgi:hypothetical protein
MKTNFFFCFSKEINLKTFAFSVTATDDIVDDRHHFSFKNNNFDHDKKKRGFLNEKRIIFFKSFDGKFTVMVW